MQDSDLWTATAIATFVFLLVILLLASSSRAQDVMPDDVRYDPIRQRGDYIVKLGIPDDPSIVSVCVKRVDVVPQIVLGCVPASANQIVEVGITVQVTPNDDAELRGFSYDGPDRTLANESEPSLNAGVLDFTPPGRVRFLQ